MRKIRYGIVGTGQMGRTHLENLQNSLPGAEVVAICARNETKIRKLQEEFDVANGYTDYDKMLRNPEIEAVIVATGSDMHREHVVKACSAEKHIFCEKPLAKTLEDCRIIEEAVASNENRFFTLGFMRRFDPSYMAAKDKIKKGAIGRPIHFRGISLDPSSVLDAHLERVKRGIYMPWFIEMGSHDADLARWFLEDEPEECLATGDAYVCEELDKYNDYDNGFSLSRFANGASAYIHVGRTHTCSHVATEIVGTKGTLTVNTIPRTNYVGQFTEQGYQEECQHDFRERWEKAFFNEIKDFTNCIIEGRKPDITAEDGTAALKYCILMHEAYLKGKKR
ncbi:MAG: Gfo/Idh/MocA family oxidoreductase [Spirochaetales bacterium]|nr:Gfo/Idh/MocA family oxidoreductase [Spirochaetales bacterium]